ncbi:hypothetical protein E8E13_003965 [Curvularia kusanoi]|uniref:Uncharacterized protein n=1 Tax=Curvularia kusanoi TaxID=90978 RepID=A0A9P4T797_CURKU|nr:hypothetical protein E8E13_003965 [Curvularia kusanoi]
MELPSTATFLLNINGFNLAVQPATNPGTVKLKKAAVKIVGVAGPAPGATPQGTKGNDTTPFQKANVQPDIPSNPSPEAHTPPQAIKLGTSSLDDMFARLASPKYAYGTNAIAPLPQKSPPPPAKFTSPVRPDKDMFKFEDFVDAVPVPTKESDSGRAQADGKKQSEQSGREQLEEVKRALLTKMNLNPKPLPSAPLRDHHKVDQSQQEAPGGMDDAAKSGDSQSTLEAEYLRKATAYLNDFPCKPGESAHLIKNVAGKLRAAFAASLTEPVTDNVEKLRSRYVFAIVNYVNQKVKMSSKPLTANDVKSLLQIDNGDLLRLCATLKEDGFLAFHSLEHVTNLCQYILYVEPPAGASSSSDNSVPEKRLDAGGSGQIATSSGSPRIAKVSAELPMDTTGQSTKFADDPMEGLKAWPTAEKRDHGAIYRTCVLKGVSGVKSLHQLQALVWGGKLESISMPESGSEQAQVKFLTPEACQTYLDSTQNGIELHGDTKKTFVFVDKHSEPNSINDVIQNCIDGNASRCVRAVGADDDWSDEALVKLAGGRQQIPRDIDCVRQGKTARGHHYLEFRFGNIYHALNFKRYLASDEEWEHCSIIYAPDPCQLASGVHDKD